MTTPMSTPVVPNTNNTSTTDSNGPHHQRRRGNHQGGKCRRHQSVMVQTPQQQADLLRKRHNNISRRLSVMAEKETKLKQHLQLLSHQLQNLQEDSTSSAPSPSTKRPHAGQLKGLKKRQENITRRLALIAEKDNKPPRMIANEAKLKERLEVISAKIQAIESTSSSSSSSPSPSPSQSSPRCKPGQLKGLKKRQENITRRLSEIAEKEEKSPRMVANEAKLNQRLQDISAKIQALESQSSPCISPSSSPCVSPSRSSPRCRSGQLEGLKKRQDNITRRLSEIAEKEEKSPKMVANEAKLNQRLELISSKIQALESQSSPSPSPSPSPSSRCSSGHLKSLKKREENITRRLSEIAKNEDKSPKMIANEAKLNQRLDVISAKIQALEADPSPSLSPLCSSSPRPSPSPRCTRQLEQLKKREENITHRLSVIAEKENKPTNMIAKEAKLKQRLDIISAKIQALKSNSSSPSPSTSPCPSPSRSPRCTRQLEQLKKREENMTHRLTVLAKKENKSPKMIANEAKLKQRLEFIAKKIQAVENGTQKHSPRVSGRPVRVCQRKRK